MFWDRYDNYDPFFGMPAQRLPRGPARVVRPTNQHFHDEDMLDMSGWPFMRQPARKTRPANQHRSQHHYDEDMLDMSGWPFMRQPARKARPATRPRGPVQPKPKHRDITLEEAEAAATLLQTAFRTYRVQKHKVLPNMRKSQESVQDSIRRFTAKLSNKTRTAEQTRFCYATFAEELTREMLNLDKITTHNETVVREKRKALVCRIQTLLSEVDRELPKWETRAEEELSERRRLKEAQRQAEEEAHDRAAEEEMMCFQGQTSAIEDPECNMEDSTSFM